MHERRWQTPSRTPGDLGAPDPRRAGKRFIPASCLCVQRWDTSLARGVGLHVVTVVPGQTPGLPRRINEHILHLGTMTVALNLLVSLATVSFSSVLSYKGTTPPRRPTFSEIRTIAQ